MKKIYDFLNSQRGNYTNEDNNKFAFSFYRATRYWEFIIIIFRRYQELSDRWYKNRATFHEYHQSSTIESMKTDMVDVGGDGKVNLKVMSLFNESEEIETSIQLEIESFYLFAKTFLDKLANAVWVYFGKVHIKHCTLTSHDDFVRHFTEYAELKTIRILTPELLNHALALRQKISDFRDWQISHEKNPERGELSSRMTILDTEGHFKLRIIRFFSETNREEIFSGKLNELLNGIETYSGEVIDMIQANSHLSKYKKMDSR